MPFLTITWEISKIEVAGFSTVPSLAFNASGQPVVTYYSSINHELRLATLNANATSWDIATVDSGVFGDAAPSLAFHFNQPAISYRAVHYEDGDVAKPVNELSYALFRGSSWTINRVAPVRGYSSLAFNASKRAGVAYADLNAKELRYAYAESPWTTWVSALVETGSVHDPALAFSASGQPAIGYAADLDARSAVIGYATSHGPTWTRQDVASARRAVCYGLAFAPSGEPAICYGDAGERTYGNLLVDRLVYAVPSGGGWVPQTIAQPAESGSLAFSPLGEPAVSYHDAGAEAIKYAVFTNRSWTHFTVEQAGKNQFGEFVGPFTMTSLAFSPSGQPAISYYDRADGSIKYAIGSQTLRGGFWGWLRPLLRLLGLQ